jgi:hypothetical protein
MLIDRSIVWHRGNRTTPHRSSSALRQINALGFAEIFEVRSEKREARRRTVESAIVPSPAPSQATRRLRCIAEAEKSTTAHISAQSLTAYLTTSKIRDGSWRGSTDAQHLSRWSEAAGTQASQQRGALQLDSCDRRLQACSDQECCQGSSTFIKCGIGV